MEKILFEVPQALSDSQLLTVVLGVSEERARLILCENNGLRGLFSLEKAPSGMTKGQFKRLRAVHALQCRYLREEIFTKNIVSDPVSAMNFLYAVMRDKQKELFKVFFLNKGNRLLDEQTMFEGTVDETAVHIREVVKAALYRNATSIILVHNHPSGRIQPSEEDNQITRKIQSACQTVGIKVLDHIIVGDNKYFSFSEHNLI